MQVLKLEGCRKLASLDLGNLASLQRLNLLGCGELVSIKGINSLTALKVFKMVPAEAVCAAALRCHTSTMLAQVVGFAFGAGLPPLCLCACRC